MKRKKLTFEKKKKKMEKKEFKKKSLRTFMDLPLLKLPPETEITFSPGAFEKIPRELVTCEGFLSKNPAHRQREEKIPHGEKKQQENFFILTFFFLNNIPFSIVRRWSLCWNI